MCFLAPTTRELLEATITLEKQSMALYARFAKIFSAEAAVHEFWFNMARDEARHVGALDLVSTVLELEGVLDKPSPIAARAEDIDRLRILVDRIDDPILGSAADPEQICAIGSSG